MRNAARETFRQEPSTVLLVPQVELYREALQDHSPVLPLWKAGSEESGTAFCVLREGRLPGCISCGGSHMAAYKGRKEIVQNLEKRMGVQPRQRPPQGAVTATAPWALKTKPPPQTTTHRPSQIAPALLSETDFPHYKNNLTYSNRQHQYKQLRHQQQHRPQQHPRPYSAICSQFSWQCAASRI